MGDSNTPSVLNADVGQGFQLDYTAGDVVAMCMSMCSGSTTNEFEIQTRERPPLPFHQPKGGTPISATSSPLFTRLPNELLQRIVSFLPEECLNTFAAVNHDCRLLARAIQFEHLSLDYSDNDIEIVDSLRSEHDQSASELGRPRLALGPCIRRLKVNTAGANFSQRHGFDLPTLNGRSQAERDAALHQAAEFYFNQYIPRVLYNIAYGLPNLEQLEWLDMINLSAAAWSAILTSPVRHMKLFRVNYDDKTLQTIRELPPMLSERLETLVLELCPSFGNFNVTVSSYDMAIEVLNRCPALEKLDWDGGFSHRNKSDDSANKLSTMCHMRSLSVSSIKFASVGDMSALIDARAGSALEHLTLDFADQDILTYLAAIGTIPSLKSFVWMGRSDPPVDFLETNTQLELLSLRNCTAEFLDTAALPLLAAYYRHLQSLEMVYVSEHSVLSEVAMGAISQLTSLVKLHLGVGHQFGWRRTWVANHMAIRNCIKHLPALKLLALSRDTYDWDQTEDPEIYDKYYSTSSIRPRDDTEWQLLESQLARDDDEDEDEENFEAQEIRRQERSGHVFEMLHRLRMLQEARKYVDLRHGDIGDGEPRPGGPKLEFIYFGELPMRVRMGWHGLRPLAASQRRDGLYTFLRRTFQNVTDLFTD